MTEVDVQKKIFEILTGSATLAAEISDRVYDLPPEGTEFPYVTIGNDEFAPWDTHDSSGFNAVLTIDVWTQAGGRKKAKEINGIIYDLLHNMDLGIVDTCTLNLKRSFATTIIDPDGATIHGINKFNLLLGV